MGMEWDEDIASMTLSDVEKNGLQVYRNYQKAFASKAESVFAAEMDAKSDRIDLDALERVLVHVANEDARFLPVIFCAYADDLLKKKMFKAELPEGIPGGKAAMFGAFGPISNFGNRLQLAFAFDMLSQDIILDLDRVRKARNDLSHTWDIEAHREFFDGGSVSEIHPIEDWLVEGVHMEKSKLQERNPLKAFRLRLTWLVARLAYEGPWYALARKRHLDPIHTLYGPIVTTTLKQISQIAMASCHQIAE